MHAPTRLKYRSRPPHARIDPKVMAKGIGSGLRSGDACPYERPRPARSFLMIGCRNEPRGFLVSARPVIRCAICKNILVVRWLAAISAIIWPLLAAVPNIRESNGIEAIGGLSIVLVNPRASISGRFGMRTWFRQYSGARSLGRADFSMFKIFLVLRRLARSGSATTRISSAPTSTRLVHPDHWCG